MNVSVLASAVPAELRERRQWVAWATEDRDGNPTKVPYRADGAGRASSTDPGTWSSFGEAVDAADWLSMDGVGYVFADDDPYCGIDLDAALPASDRGAIICALDSYTETSVSGAGAHVIVRASVPAGRHPAGLGVFDHGRYFVMTGAHVRGTPSTIEERQAQLDDVLAHYLPRPKPPRPPQPIELDDRELLERAFRSRSGADFMRLYQGDTSGFSSHSEADLAFCRTAAFRTGRDPARIDAWLRSSGLMRDKWERADYRQRTIEAAIAGTKDVYTPAPPAAASRNGPEPEPEPKPQLELRIVPLVRFADVEESGAAGILGTPENEVVPEGGDAMVYGDGGVGKTTLVIDLACHLAAGDDWLGLTVQRPVRVLVIENEGPRPLFRRKLDRKRTGWGGSPIDDRIQILEHPWGQLDFGELAWHEALAAEIATREIDVVVAGPVTSIGMEGAGTMAEARAFIALVDELRRRSGRPIAVLLVHHENKGGKVSGAWEGIGDTLLHVQQQGHGRVRLYLQKVRWASDQHATTLQLVWAAGDSFELAEPDANRPEQVWETLEQFVRENPGCNWNKVLTAKNDDGTKVVRGQVDYLARRRDQMLGEGVLINAGRPGSFALWHRDDPARPQIFEDEAGPFPEAERVGKSGVSDLAGEGFPEDRFPVSRPIWETGIGETTAASSGTVSDPGKIDPSESDREQP
jgi:hypothetical protein